MMRSQAMREMDHAAAGGMVALQSCASCGMAQYPPRSLCHACLSADLAWSRALSIEGVVLAATVLHHSHEPDFRSALPLRVGMVHLDCGPQAVCFVQVAEPGTRVRVTATLDAQGRAVLTAQPFSMPKETMG